MLSQMMSLGICLLALTLACGTTETGVVELDELTSTSDTPVMLDLTGTDTEQREAESGGGFAKKIKGSPSLLDITQPKWGELGSSANAISGAEHTSGKRNSTDVCVDHPEWRGQCALLAEHCSSSMVMKARCRKTCGCGEKVDIPDSVTNPMPSPKPPKTAAPTAMPTATPVAPAGDTDTPVNSTGYKNAQAEAKKDEAKQAQAEQKKKEDDKKDKAEAAQQEKKDQAKTDKEINDMQQIRKDMNAMTSVPMVTPNASNQTLRATSVRDVSLGDVEDLSSMLTTQNASAPTQPSQTPLQAEISEQEKKEVQEEAKQREVKKLAEKEARRETEEMELTKRVAEAAAQVAERKATEKVKAAVKKEAKKEATTILQDEAKKEVEKEAEEKKKKEAVEKAATEAAKEATAATEQKMALEAAKKEQETIQQKNAQTAAETAAKKAINNAAPQAQAAPQQAPATPQPQAQASAVPATPSLCQDDPGWVTDCPLLHGHMPNSCETYMAMRKHCKKTCGCPIGNSTLTV